MYIARRFERSESCLQCTGGDALPEFGQLAHAPCGPPRMLRPQRLDSGFSVAPSLRNCCTNRFARPWTSFESEWLGANKVRRLAHRFKDFAAHRQYVVVALDGQRAVFRFMGILPRKP